MLPDPLSRAGQQAGIAGQEKSCVLKREQVIYQWNVGLLGSLQANWRK